jgi:hypothetical protein
MSHDKTMAGTTTETISTQQREQLSRRKQEVRRRLDQVREDAEKLAESTKATAADLTSMLREHLTERPLLVVSGAFACRLAVRTAGAGVACSIRIRRRQAAAPLALTEQAVAQSLV